MAEKLQNNNNFTPTEKQLSFLEAYLSQEVRESIESLCDKANVDRTTYYQWLKKPDFNEWFYKQIEANKYRFAPRILDNVFTRAMSKEASTQDKELALKVLQVYTPTQKNINENIDITDDKINEVLEKAKELLES